MCVCVYLSVCIYSYVYMCLYIYMNAIDIYDDKWSDISFAIWYRYMRYWRHRMAFVTLLMPLLHNNRIW